MPGNASELHIICCPSWPSMPSGQAGGFGGGKERRNWRTLRSEKTVSHMKLYSSLELETGSERTICLGNECWCRGTLSQMDSWGHITRLFYMTSLPQTADCRVSHMCVLRHSALMENNKSVYKRWALWEWPPSGCASWAAPQPLWASVTSDQWWPLSLSLHLFPNSSVCLPPLLGTDTDSHCFFFFFPTLISSSRLLHNVPSYQPGWLETLKVANNGLALLILLPLSSGITGICYHA